MKPQAEIRFGGVPIAPSDEVFANIRANWPLRTKILNAALDQFRANPKNEGLLPPAGAPATLEQVWNLFWILGVAYPPYCLLSAEQPEVPTGRIEKIIKMSSAQLVEALKSIGLKEHDLRNIELLHYDGSTGHCITLKRYEPERDRFIYHDPWPLDSLLTEKNNEAGVCALPENDRKWSVTTDELQKVAFAAFVFPSIWERLQNNLPEMRLSDFERSRFFHSFSLVQTAQYDHSEDKETQYCPRTFVGLVIVSLLTNRTGRITSAKLLMTKEWMKANWQFVPDLSINFLRAIVPKRDQKQCDELLRNLSLRNFAGKVSELAKDSLSATGLDAVLLAWSGITPSAGHQLPFSDLHVDNSTLNGNPMLIAKVNLP